MSELESTENPFSPPYEQLFLEEAPPRSYGGIGRTAYAFLILASALVSMVLGAAFVRSQLLFVPIAVFVLFKGLITLLRLKNLGYSGVWVFAFLVPVLNVVVWVRCLVAPEGYADDRRLDDSAVFFLLFLLTFGVLAVLA